MRSFKKETKTATLFISGECPLNCSYCWIPKSKIAAKIHKKIKKGIKSGLYFNNLKETIGDQLESILLLGAEPALSLGMIEKKLKHLKKQFPNLRLFRMYTTMVNWKSVSSFIKECDRHGFEVEIVISLDGPDFVTEKTNKNMNLIRMVPENIISLTESIQNVNSRVQFSWKSTVSNPAIREMNKDEEKINEFISFFTKIHLKFNEVNQNENINFRNNISTTVTTSESHSKKDGLQLAEFIRKMYKKNIILQKNGIIAKTLNLDGVAALKNSCYGGNSNISIGEGIHICQRTFLYNEEEYLRESENFTEEEISLFKENLIASPKPESWWKLKFLKESQSGFFKFRVEHVKNLAKEMVEVGQVDQKFTEDEWAVLLLILRDCMIENFIHNKSVHLIKASELRFWGNGALEEMVKIALAHDY